MSADLFRSLLSDIREATQTLANCAAKGALKKDGTRMSHERKYVRDIRLTCFEESSPDCQWDWRAMYDGDDETPSRHGWGRTPEEALADLKEALADNKQRARRCVPTKWRYDEDDEMPSGWGPTTDPVEAFAEALADLKCRLP